MQYLSFSKSDLSHFQGEHTATEITHQPNVWKLTAEKLNAKSNLISSFIESALKEVDQIILTGAGSSCFIGYSLAGLMFQQYKIPCKVVPTTDIVSFPNAYFDTSYTYLIISFARSGNSPESIATLKFADQKSKKCFHLIITCNEEGDLTNYQTSNPKLGFNLPSDTNDKSLAMTSSYSSMLLCGLFVNYLANKETFLKQLNLSIAATEKILTKQVEKIKHIAHKDFKRAVFLGSGALHGTATEAALKLQELTNGKVICTADTFLGFRHGPKAVVDEDTLMVYFFNNNTYAQKYELDLIESMKKGNPALSHLGISENPIASDLLENQIHLSVPSHKLDEAFQPLTYIVPAQIIGFFKSIQLGFKPDNPSENGAISRVVEGVNIYTLVEN